MDYTMVKRTHIMGQRIPMKEEDVLNLIKRIVAIIISIVFAYSIFAMIWSLPMAVLWAIFMVLGVTLAVIGILTNIRHHSPATIGVINRSEFYGIMVALIGYLFYMNGRIDQIMLFLMNK